MLTDLMKVKAIKEIKHNYYDLRSKKVENLKKNLNTLNFKKSTLGGCIFTKKGDNFLIPQRLNNFEKFLFIVSKNTGLGINEISYISPLWTYKLLTTISVLMIIGEIVAFLN